MALRAYARDYFYWSDRIATGILNGIEPGPALLRRLSLSLSVAPVGVTLQQRTETGQTYGERARHIRKVLRSQMSLFHLGFRSMDSDVILQGEPRPAWA